MRIHETKVYQFDELSDEAKETAIEQCAYWNVDGLDWWEWVYDDAREIGLEIEEFDITRRSSCSGKWHLSAVESAKAIITNHGESCDTHKDAKAFLDEYYKLRNAFEQSADYDPDYQEFDDTDDYEVMEDEFYHTIQEDYRIMLEQEYEYLTSEEAIIETIEANAIEFTENGKRF
jgi:hypothetical protein